MMKRHLSEHLKHVIEVVAWVLHHESALIDLLHPSHLIVKEFKYIT